MRCHEILCANGSSSFWDCYESLPSLGPLTWQETQRLCAAGDVAHRIGIGFSLAFPCAALCMKPMKGPAPTSGNCSWPVSCRYGLLLDQVAPARTVANTICNGAAGHCGAGRRGSSLFPRTLDLTVFDFQWDLLTSKIPLNSDRHTISARAFLAAGASDPAAAWHDAVLQIGRIVCARNHLINPTIDLGVGSESGRCRRPAQGDLADFLEHVRAEEDVL